MQVILRGISGPGADIAAELFEGQPLSVGRTERARLTIPQDSALSGLHFRLELKGESVLLTDLGSSNGTFVNGVRVREQILFAGDSVAAGGSVFRIETSAAEPAPIDLVEFLSTQREPLFAVLDAARDPKIYPLLAGGGAEYRSLYNGKSAAQLEHVAPYLVPLPPRCELLKKLVEQGWGNAWGIFLTCDQPLEEVRHQLRKSLMVTLEKTRETVYFRFYDPRVLRVFLLVADLRQVAEFAGAISRFIVEGERPIESIEFSAAEDRLVVQSTTLSSSL